MGYVYHTFLYFIGKVVEDFCIKIFFVSTPIGFGWLIIHRTCEIFAFEGTLNIDSLKIANPIKNFEKISLGVKQVRYP